MGEKIVLGFGNNIDYEIRWNSSIVEKLIRDFRIHAAELNIDNNSIGTERELLINILGFLKDSIGGERFISNPKVIENFSGYFSKKVTVGGTSIRAAIAMAKLGCCSALHLVTLNDDVRRLLPKTCSWICSNKKETSYPHLIVQFHMGLRVDANDIHLESKRPNRIIYPYDIDNEIVLIDPGVTEMAKDAQVFLVSGFNSMHDEALLEDRVKQVRGILKALPDDTVVFFEDACYHIQKFSDILRSYLLDDIDIYSLNEDELGNYCGRTVVLTDPEDIGSALKELRKKIPCGILVVHTHCWALAYGEKAADYRDALLGGVTMATTRFRFGDDFTSENYIETGRLPLEEEGEKFSCGIKGILGNMVCSVPSFKVSERDVTTIGLGDAFVGGFLPALVK
ncbi:MAG: ADP-dependent glucokinase/phosphofructokinase [Treponema sp.]|jgi:ADP-dependent phosphofructokinase/glucokinase|nr:ADP-dependent glucokinase/phosphofructokinase [Treponema sp.]